MNALFKMSLLGGVLLLAGCAAENMSFYEAYSTVVEKSDNYYTQHSHGRAQPAYYSESRPSKRHYRSDVRPSRKRNDQREMVVAENRHYKSGPSAPNSGYRSKKRHQKASNEFYSSDINKSAPKDHIVDGLFDGQ